MPAYQDIAIEMTSEASFIRMQINGTSMAPLLQDGEYVIVQTVAPGTLRIGDLVSFRNGANTITHRVVRIHPDSLLTLGDNLSKLDPLVKPALILGRVIAVEKNNHQITLSNNRWALANKLLGWLGWQTVVPNRFMLISKIFRVLFLFTRKSLRFLIFS